MPQGNVGEVEQRRLVRSAGVHDLEDGLQIPIQVNDRTYLSLEHEEIISPVPPSMSYAPRQVHALAGPCISALAADHCRQCAGGNHPFLILKVMNVQRGAVAMRRQRTSQLKDEFPSLLLPPKLEDLAGVAILQSEIAPRGEIHSCSWSNGMPNDLRFCRGACRSRRRPSSKISCGG
jgi:hypothetical protein